MTSVPPQPPQMPQEQPMGVGAQVKFLPGPANMNIDRVDLGGVPHVFIAVFTPQSSTGVYFTLDGAMDLADKIREKAGSGLSIVKGGAGFIPGMTQG